MRCDGCVGTGSILGLGMVKIECPKCDGTGKVASAEEEAKLLRKKDPEAFDAAKDKILAADATLTDKDAAAYLTKAVKDKRHKE